MSFAYVVTLGGKESLQLFGIAVAIFSEGSVVGVGIVVWCPFMTCTCCLVRVCNVYLWLWGSGLVLALNYKDL